MFGLRTLVITGVSFIKLWLFGVFSHYISGVYLSRQKLAVKPEQVWDRLWQKTQEESRLKKT